METADDDLIIVFLYADDKKELGAARRSRYYMKYGNPNYGGMKGILTNSWWDSFCLHLTSRVKHNICQSLFYWRNIMEYHCEWMN